MTAITLTHECPANASSVREGTADDRDSLGMPTLCGQDASSHDERLCTPVLPTDCRTLTATELHYCDGCGHFLSPTEPVWVE